MAKYRHRPHQPEPISLIRDADTFTEGLFTPKKLDDFVPAKHPLRVIRTMVNKVLTKMGELFVRMVVPFGDADGRYGTNPCCIGIPLAGPPFVLDFATS